MTSADEAIQELHDGAPSGGNERFRARVALIVAGMAVLLAVAALGGGNAAEDAINNNIQASDLFAWYQAKNIRQTSYELARDELELTLALYGMDLPAAARERLEQRLADYQATVERYDSEPDPADPDNPLKGEGKRELLAQATYYQTQRNQALAREPNFDYAEALFQTAIVVASISILLASRPVLYLGLGVGAVALLFMLNGFFMWVVLPF